MRREPGQLFFLTTQGCKVNQYESQAIREALVADGLMETDDPSLADIVLINSCAVTERAVLDLAKLVRSLASASPKPWIVVAGCAVEADRERILAMDAVDEIIAQKDKTLLGSPNQTKAPFPALAISGYNRARGVIKVQDGCSHGCTYCIIPTTRGRSVSRPAEEIISEASRLLDSGIREISLCGINLRHYGRDLPAKEDFWDLLTAVDQALSPRWAGRARLRLGSLEPGDLNAKALSTLAQSRLMTPHLHISLQSGSREVLRRMGRGHYGPEQIFDFLRDLREIWPVFGLGADLIAGFPGETGEHADETLEVVRRLPLSYAHVFPYSERPGTPAVDFKGSVPGHIRRERAKALRREVSLKRADFLLELLKLPAMDVALEDGGTGMNEFYVECAVSDAPSRARELLRVVPTGLTSSGLTAKLAREQREGA
ncbi:radical SAM methylthiotransferase, MiaB/RimO family [Desulfomicrobium norvegicum]|uniref:Radical SAM methylthiotransferase, MiaB/RimO family n=1 Tax=Desulfomicrobium norvegicum (strain DSM 1741 / NCIMB 8310) TaxID=52561 RepID=A0A8G2F6U6_DESNO|nr:MiaB/RimO family radical SAM methylthiotransferase [Desulfomicrobium norvegicum]SFL52045.1 radical SAM methylthiotransferase, MiaB/RimO family [Desulfomicrobium norvegicum]